MHDGPSWLEAWVCDLFSSMVVSIFIALRQAEVSNTGLDVPPRFKECVPHTETYPAQQELGIQNRTKGLLFVPNMSQHQISRIWVLGQNTQWGFQFHLLPPHPQLQWIDHLSSASQTRRPSLQMHVLFILYFSWEDPPSFLLRDLVSPISTPNCFWSVIWTPM